MIHTKWMWLARDAGGVLYEYTHKPHKDSVALVWDCKGGAPTRLPTYWFPNVKWTDPQPTRVKITYESTPTVVRTTHREALKLK